MTLRLNGSTSGYTEIDAPAAAGSNTLVLPTGNGSAGNILGTDGSGNLSWVNGRMVLGTSQASTSGTSIDFTGIPSWAKRVTVMFNGVSLSGSSNGLVQLGTASGIENTGYSSSGGYIVGGGTSTVNSSTAGFVVTFAAAANAITAVMTINLLTSNTWVSAHSGSTGSSQAVNGGGNKSLSGTLDRIRITTVNGTDTFDAGSINILYEG